MRIRKSLFLLLCVLMAGSINNLFAQKHSDADLDTMQSVVKKNFTPTIAPAVKINTMPNYRDSTNKVKLGPYSIFSTQLPTTFDLLPIKPVSIQGEPLQKLYPALVKFDISYPYQILDAAAYYNSLRSKENAYGFYVKTLSSEANASNGNNMGYYDNEISLYAKKFYNNATLSGNIDFSRNLVHYYGYNPTIFEHPNQDSLKQYYNLIKAEVKLVGNRLDSVHPAYQALLAYNNFTDAFKTSENWLKAFGQVQGFYDHQLVSLDGTIDYLNHRSSSDTTNDLILNLKPQIYFEKSNWKAIFGSPIAADFGVISKLYWYPKAEINVQLVPGVLGIMAGVNGALERNSMELLSAINPFLIGSFQLKNTDIHHEFLGFSGQIDRNTYFKLSGNVNQVNNLPLFVLNPNDAMHNKFIAVYDNANIIGAHAELKYLKEEKIEVKVELDYNHYTMSTFAYAWYKPEIRVGFSANYSIGNQIYLLADVFYLGSQHYLAYNAVNQSFNGVISGFTDVNLGLDYRYSKKFTIDLKLNNLASANYQRWYNYPSQGIYGTIGIKVAL